MSTRGWITKASRKKGDVWLHHFYRLRDTDGKNVETCSTVGPVFKFPKEADVWEEIKRRQQTGSTGRMTVASLAES